MPIVERADGPAAPEPERDSHALLWSYEGWLQNEFFMLVRDIVNYDDDHFFRMRHGRRRTSTIQG